jgi:hypothetical protein
MGSREGKGIVVGKVLKPQIMQYLQTILITL